MQKKMTLLFAVPIISVYIILNTICYQFILDKYEEQLQHSVQQTIRQAQSFLESYIQNMEYLLNIIEYNGEVQQVLQSDEYLVSKDLAEEYREFYNLNKSFTQMSMMDSSYNLEMYVDKNKFYSVNREFFFDEEVLNDLENFKEIKQCLDRGESYLTEEDIRGWESVTLLKRIFTTGIIREPKNICGVSIKKSIFEQILKNANITSNGLVLLMDQNDQTVCSSNDEIIKNIKLNREFLSDTKEKEWQKIKLQGEEYFITKTDIADIGWQMISLIPVQEYAAQYTFIKYFRYMMAIVLALLVIVTSAVLSRNYVGRLRNLGEKMSILPQKNLNVHLPVTKNEKGDELSEIYRNFNYMVTELQRLMQEHYKLGKEVRMTEMKALQAQINPHFLYNTLDLINWMAMDYGASDIEKLVWKLARFYRLSLNKGKNVLTVQEEIEHVQMYLDIENMHFSDAIEYKIEIPEEIKERMCLNIILQPLVENAIVHGIAEKSEIEHMKIEIRAEQKEGDIIFYVQDDGPGMTEEQINNLENEYMNVNGKGYGVKNINFRIKLCFGEKYGITYKSQIGKGTTAKVRIPELDADHVDEMIE